MTSAAPRPPLALRACTWLAYGLGVALLLTGFDQFREARSKYGDYLDWFGPVAGGWLLLWLVGARLFPRHLLKVSLLTALVLAALAQGMLAPLVVLLAASAAWLVGDLVFGRALPLDERDGAQELLVGIAGYALVLAALYTTSHLPLHRWWVYLSLLLGLHAARLHRARDLVRRLWQVLDRVPAQTRTEWSALWIVGGALLILLVHSFRTDIGYDALVMHLVVPHLVQVAGSFPYPIEDAIWSTMPIGADWGYTLVYLLAGEGAIHLLLVVVFTTMVALLVTTVRRFLPGPGALLIGALLATSSMAFTLTGAAFVDGTVGLFQFAALVALLTYDRTGRRIDLLLVGVLLGGAVLCKLTSVLVAVLALITLLALEVRAGRLRTHRKALFAAVAAAALVGCFPYVNAWVLTGVPTYPFYGELFGKPVLDDAGVDLTRYTHPITWRLLFDVTFQSGRYVEGHAGAFGYFAVLLVPMTPLLLVGARCRAGWVALALALSTFLAIFQFQSYLRYVFGALPMFLVAAGVGLGWLREAQPRLWRTTAITCAILCVFQLRQFPASAPWMQPLPLGEVLRGDRSSLAAGRRYAGLVEHLNERYGTDARVCFFGPPYRAGLDASAVAVNWYSWEFGKAMRAATAADEVARLVVEQGVTHVLVDDSRELRAVWRAFLDQGAELEERTDKASLYRLRTGD